MVKVLALASVVWPLLLGAAVWQRASGEHPTWTTVLYLSAGQICHQRPERSFSTAGVQWPVCGRCSGLYLAGPVGAWAALLFARRRAGRAARSLAVLAAPTVVTIGLEWTGLAPITNELRALAALPLGGAVGYWIVRAASGAPPPIRYTDQS